MKKYIDMLTIGNLSPNLLSVLAPLRLEYNIVSCRTESSAELIKPLSKLILTEKEHAVYINNELVNLPYIEFYLENAATKIDLGELDYYYSIAVNKKNVENLPQIIHNLSCDKERNYIFENKSMFIVVVPKSEFETIEQMPESVQTFIEFRSDKIIFLQSELPYDYCRLIPAIQYMKENNLDTKILVQVDADVTTYNVAAREKLARLLTETDNCAIMAAASPDTLFDTPVISNELTAVKPCFFTDLLWEGLRPAVITNSPANYWHTFNLWASDVSQTTYYTKFYKIPTSNSIAHLKTKTFYNELARLGINKLLTEEV